MYSLLRASPSRRRKVREAAPPPYAPPTQPFQAFAPSRPPAARGRRTLEMAFLPTRRSWCRFSHAPPALSAFGETANQRHASCDAIASFRLVSRAQLSRRRFADSPRRAPACAGAAHTQAFFRNAALGVRDHVGTFPPPSRRSQIASHCYALVAATGVPATPLTT